MAVCAPTSLRSGAVLAVGVLVVVAGSAPAQVLPWEVTVAEIEAGGLRYFAQRLSKQYLLYQLHLGDVRKDDLADTAAHIDRVLDWLERGSPSHSVPAAWTPALRQQVRRVQGVWNPIRRIAMASPYEYMRLLQEYVPSENRRADPLALRYFDDVTLDFIAESEKLIDVYHQECSKTGSEFCSTARTAGYAAMIVERATKEAVCVFADLDREENRARLRRTIEAYREVRRANDQNPVFAAALDPARGVSGKAAAELLVSLRSDWDEMQDQFTILSAGDERNFDLPHLLALQLSMVEKVERLTSHLVRYASVNFGS
jgi:hypothetical protein